MAHVAAAVKNAGNAAKHQHRQAAMLGYRNSAIAQDVWAEVMEWLENAKVEPLDFTENPPSSRENGSYCPLKLLSVSSKTVEPCICCRCMCSS